MARLKSCPDTKARAANPCDSVVNAAPEKICANFVLHRVADRAQWVRRLRLSYCRYFGTNSSTVRLTFKKEREESDAEHEEQHEHHQFPLPRKG
jgi:hypothetical protein